MFDNIGNVDKERNTMSNNIEISTWDDNWRKTTRLSVDFDQITTDNFRCGDILSCSDGEQYVIVDVFDPLDSDDVPGYAFLEKLEPSDRVRPELTTGRVEF